MKPNISYFTFFYCKCFILNNGNDSLCKFDVKSNEGIFLGYSYLSKEYIAYNYGTTSIEAPVHVVFDESSPQKMEKVICSDVSGLITENLINNNIFIEDPPQQEEEGIIKDKGKDKQDASSQLPPYWIVDKRSSMGSYTW